MRCLLLLLSFALMGTQTHAEQTPSSRIAAVVNRNIITQSDLMNRLKFAAITSGLEPTLQNTEPMKDQMLRVMIDEQLQLELGKKYGIVISDQQIKETMDDIEKTNGMTPGYIAQLLQKNKIPMKTFEDHLKAQIIWVIYIREKYPLKTLEELVRKKVDNDISPSLQIADWEVDREMQAHKQMGTKTQYHLAEIVLPVDRSDQEEAVKKNMDQLIVELNKGAQFSVLAQQFSQSNTANQGGDLGWITEDQLEPEIKDVILKIAPGQLSTPIRTPNGYTLIAYLEKRLPDRNANLLMTFKQLLFPFPKGASDDKMKEIISYAEQVYAKAKSCSTIESVAKTTFPETLIQTVQDEPTGSFPQELLAMLNQLDINQVSQPVVTPEGGVLIMLCDKKVEQVKEITRDEAIAKIASSKHSLLGKRELRDIRRQAFIDIRT